MRNIWRREIKNINVNSLLVHRDHSSSRPNFRHSSYIHTNIILITKQYLFVYPFITVSLQHMASCDFEVKTRWPLHYHVWVGDRVGLERHIQSPDLSAEGIETLDPRGNTPLMLAVMLGEVELVRLLLSHGSKANVTNKNGWSALHEATARGNADLVSCLLRQSYNLGCDP